MHRTGHAGMDGMAYGEKSQCEFASHIGHHKAQHPTHEAHPNIHVYFACRHDRHSYMYTFVIYNYIYICIHIYIHTYIHP